MHILSSACIQGLVIAGVLSYGGAPLLAQQKLRDADVLGCYTLSAAPLVDSLRYRGWQDTIRLLPDHTDRLASDRILRIVGERVPKADLWVWGLKGDTLTIWAGDEFDSVLDITAKWTAGNFAGSINTFPQQLVPRDTAVHIPRPIPWAAEGKRIDCPPSLSSLPSNQRFKLAGAARLRASI